MEQAKIDETMDALKRKLDESRKENDQLKAVLKKLQRSPLKNQDEKE